MRKKFQHFFKFFFKKFGEVHCAAIFWIIFVFIWPEALNAVFARKAEISLKSLEEHQKQKNQLYLPFEKKYIKNIWCQVNYFLIIKESSFFKFIDEGYWFFHHRRLFVRSTPPHHSIIPSFPLWVERTLVHLRKKGGFAAPQWAFKSLGNSFYI